MCAFIAEHRARFGVAQICRVLTAHGAKISPRTFYAWAARPLSTRALWDTTITEIMVGYYEADAEGRRPPESLYGAVKMWAYLQRQGIPVARCTVERLMRSGWQGVTRRKRVRTTIANPSDERAPDLVDRQFKVPAPNQLIVADFTYVPMAGGSHMYTAFAIDAYAGRIVGWECSSTKTDKFVRTAVRHAAELRRFEGKPFLGNTIHHSDAGSQTGFNRWTQHLDERGVEWDDHRDGQRH
ncbi:helix-turn-helix protein [Williamsia limnetica]|uniref:Helix-turn-helix protein n=1 Tax=Williamsia limnetica TaxID=882452 RepID=A0A318RBA7_WILLI|nr:helix-turn-helix protein [Williamsia limnetica]